MKKWLNGADTRVLTAARAIAVAVVGRSLEPLGVRNKLAVSALVSCRRTFQEHFRKRRASRLGFLY
jgi:hypothetical protein